MNDYPDDMTLSTLDRLEQRASSIRSHFWMEVVAILQARMTQTEAQQGVVGSQQAVLHAHLSKLESAILSVDASVQSFITKLNATASYYAAMQNDWKELYDLAKVFAEAAPKPTKKTKKASVSKKPKTPVKKRRDR
jgi:hypothetical protein